MSPLRQAEMLCTIGKIVIRIAYVIGAIPAAITFVAFLIYLVGRAILDQGNRQWNDLHGIENPKEPTTAVAEASMLAKAWGIDATDDRERATCIRR